MPSLPQQTLHRFNAVKRPGDLCKMTKRKLLTTDAKSAIINSRKGETKWPKPKRKKSCVF